MSVWASSSSSSWSRCCSCSCSCSCSCYCSCSCCCCCCCSCCSCILSASGTAPKHTPCSNQTAIRAPSVTVKPRANCQVCTSISVWSIWNIETPLKTTLTTLLHLCFPRVNHSHKLFQVLPEKNSSQERSRLIWKHVSCNPRLHQRRVSSQILRAILKLKHRTDVDRTAETSPDQSWGTAKVTGSRTGRQIEQWTFVFKIGSQLLFLALNPTRFYCVTCTSCTCFYVFSHQKREQVPGPKSFVRNYKTQGNPRSAVRVSLAVFLARRSHRSLHRHEGVNLHGSNPTVPNGTQIDGGRIILVSGLRIQNTEMILDDVPVFWTLAF